MSAAVREPSRTGMIEFDGHPTWYRVTGELDPSAAAAPLVVVHGGPGAAHDYCLTMTSLGTDGRAVVHYDRLGCGRSTHLPDVDPDYWSVGLFVRELRTVVDALGIGDRFHLLGQSWGGMLAPEFVLADGAGVLSMTIADSPASMPLWLQAAATLRARLPQDVQDTLDRHEQADSTDSSEYLEAMNVFYARHVCRVQPLPAEVAATFAQIDEDPAVYHTMNGPSEFHVIGSIRDWQCKDRLGDIDVPTLLVSGRYDEATPVLQRTLLDGIRGSEWVEFEDSAHLPHVEEPERYLDVVSEWFCRWDRAPSTV
jgi:L-proline amide hydrolase